MMRDDESSKIFLEDRIRRGEQGRLYQKVSDHIVSRVVCCANKECKVQLNLRRHWRSAPAITLAAEQEMYIVAQPAFVSISRPELDIWHPPSALCQVVALSLDWLPTFQMEVGESIRNLISGFNV